MLVEVTDISSALCHATSAVLCLFHFFQTTVSVKGPSGKKKDVQDLLGCGLEESHHGDPVLRKIGQGLSTRHSQAESARLSPKTHGGAHRILKKED